jgi:dTDP-4-dehydrorhamnose 3,5-epimerase
MQFMDTGIVGARLITPSPHQDERGRFMRAWCTKEFSEHSIDFSPVQSNLGFSRKKGTVRGMHFQLSPHWKQSLSVAREDPFSMWCST